MANIKGGIKLRRSGKDSSYYAGGFARTAANKIRRANRIKRRAIEYPQRTDGGATMRVLTDDFRSG